VRQARQLGDNIAAVLRGGQPTEYRHEYLGSVASLGLHKGVAQVKLLGVSVKLRGWPAWFMHRTYHLSRVPTFNRKVRVAADWTLALFFHREIVSLGALQNPHQEFALATKPETKPELPPVEAAEQAAPANEQTATPRRPD
jgi:NADH dehydrogenase